MPYNTGWAGELKKGQVIRITATTTVDFVCMRAQKERGLAVLQKHIKTDRALAEIGYKNLLEDLTAYTFTSVKGLRTVQEIVALRDPKIAKYNVEDLLDQRILKKVVDSGYVEEIERRYKIRS